MKRQHRDRWALFVLLFALGLLVVATPATADADPSQSGGRSRQGFWSLNGNTAINPDRHFIGTRGDQPVIIKADGTERLRIDPSGAVLIGTANHTSLVVNGFITQTNGHMLFSDGLDNAVFVVGQGSHPDDANNRFVFRSTPDIGTYDGSGVGSMDLLTIENTGHVGVGTFDPNSAIEAGDGYIELDTSSGTPPAADCDQADEVGRMKVDDANTNLYVCTAVGWVTK